MFPVARIVHSNSNLIYPFQTLIHHAMISILYSMKAERELLDLINYFHNLLGVQRGFLFSTMARIPSFRFSLLLSYQKITNSLLPPSTLTALCLPTVKASNPLLTPGMQNEAPLLEAMTISALKLISHVGEAKDLCVSTMGF